MFNAFKSVVVLFSVLLLLPVTSYAVVITGDLSYDDTTDVITNTVSGETYLGFDVLQDLTYAETVAMTSAGGAYESWHIASQAEAVEFFTAAVEPFTFTDDTVSYASTASTFMNGFGDNFIDSGNDVAWFLDDDTGMAGYVYFYENQVTNHFINTNWNTIDYSDNYSASPGAIVSHYPISWLLVGGTADTHAVSEPSVMALMGLGLLGLGIMRRRQKKQ